MPKVDIVKYSIWFVALGEYPPPNTPRIAFEEDAPAFFSTLLSPKSAAFPRVDKVIKSIVFTLPLAVEDHIHITPRVRDATQPPP